MRFADVPYSYLAITKPSVYSDEPRRSPRGRERRRYLIVYPMVKRRDWYALPAEERMRIMRGHIEVGRRYRSIDINTAYSFGLDDQEFVVSFDAEDPAEFLDLVQELRGTESSPYTCQRDPDLHLHLSVRRARARRARRRGRRPPTPADDMSEDRANGASARQAERNGGGERRVAGAAARSATSP